ncbi:helix-turn-helix domain-containing protein [Oceanirhabdus seepicola]|uniref:Helix-turn-helix domain-containing protein n=1 Tax=Oceanirhabdus seepicola TaxID=2828781 RepID=A0A9J6NYP9_9CLOT|nr:helix-turn-helix transcriptional regulator [Oceanirhabdus seepicola]MCM1989395.1 helix-turn-helix domain-containing protein [Oceanirhabdus seepicola]
MDTIRRINFKKTEDKLFEFEIVDLQEFFKTRPTKILLENFRMNFYNILYITSGEGKHEVDFKVYDFKAGDMILIGKNQVHRFFPDTKATGYILLFTEDYLCADSKMSIQDFLEHFNSPLYNPIINIDVSEESSNRILIDLLYKEYKAEDNAVKGSLLKSLFRSFMLAISKFKKPNEQREISGSYKRFVEFKNLVEIHYKEKKTVQDYAKMMLVSQKTINQATRAVVDLSAKQFIIDRILLEIKRYIDQGEYTINEISDLMGFDEPSNLTKFFKRYEGISPKEFRAEYFDSGR